MVYDITVIGAGIVGLATAYQILNKQPNLKLLVIEKENDIAKHQTGNNSGVIHSGIYYKSGSLKAKNCINGYKLLLDFCEKEEIKYEICGKVIVATEEWELPILNNLFERGKMNGLDRIRKIKSEELREIEPYAFGLEAIFVPYTGIIDFKEVSKKLKEKILNQGGEIIFNESVENIRKKLNLVEVIGKSKTYETKFLVTCGGLYSDRLARLTQKNLPLRIIPFRGEYYKIKDEKKHLVKNLIYPVPNPDFPFLGVHFTRMIDGKIEAGPNAVLAFKREGYKKTDFSFRDTYETLSWRGFQKVVSKYWRIGLGEFYRSYSKKAFTKALQRLIPEISEEDLILGGAGVRAQACDKNGNLIDDFFFIEEERIVHVCNAPSPAATASLSIGNFIAEKVLDRFY
ncbi:MAG: L-2-hydroxyglutarate oxidase [Ignavibacteria bacterium]